MRGVIVDLDGKVPRDRGRPLDRLSTVALVLASFAFAIVVLVARPAAFGSGAPATPTSLSADLPVPRGVVLHPLQLPRSYADVDLGAMPDRLANEAPPSSLRSVIVVRGVPGVASADGPAVIAWTENGIAYWLASPTRTTDDLIAIADDLR